LIRQSVMLATNLPSEPHRSIAELKFDGIDFYGIDFACAGCHWEAWGMTSHCDCAPVRPGRM
tara:strand:+ start:338 stop:523 length:186 start_codon:yes stop_codon:yes gene_type:complete